MIISVIIISRFFQGLNKRLDVFGSQDAGIDKCSRNKIGIDVAGGSPVLEVSRAFLGGVDGDSDAGASASLFVRELVDGGGFVFAGESLFVSVAVESDVLLVDLGELLHAVLEDEVEAALGTGLVEGEVGVAPGSVPVTLG